MEIELNGSALIQESILYKSVRNTTCDLFLLYVDANITQTHLFFYNKICK